MQSSKPEVDDFTQSITKRLGMDIERGIDADAGRRDYVRSMKKRYGKKGSRFMKHMDQHLEEAGDPDGVSARKSYQLKNSDWRMSLQVSQHSEGEKHAAFIDWLGKAAFDPPSEACEVGCDLGIQACAMKLLWPESHIVGFDQIDAAIFAAEHHAKWHALRGIDFQQLDIRAELPQDYLEVFDLAICPWTLHEMVPSTQISTDDLWGEWHRSPELEPMKVIEKVIGAVQLDSSEKRSIKNLARLVKPAGRIVSVDRMTYGNLQQRPIIRELEQHGFEQVKSDHITFESPNGQEHFPIFVLRKAA